MPENDCSPDDSGKEPKRVKPEIDELIQFYLDGETRKNAVDFVAFLRAEGPKLECVDTKLGRQK